MTTDPIPIEDWNFYANCISGLWPDGKRKKTSRIVARDGLIITTLSGSRYKLVVPVPTTADLKTIDSVIKNNTTQ